MKPRVLTLAEARRVAVAGQRLAGPRPRDVLDAVRSLGEVQMDPIAHVARTEHLVLFSRLGPRFRAAQLERALWRDRTLFEFSAHIVPTEDLAIYAHYMRRFRDVRADDGYAWYRDWIARNAAFRRHVLRELREHGPLLARDIENRSQHAWGIADSWYGSAPEVPAMLEALWTRGEVMIVGRRGQQRLWDLAERRLPLPAPRLTMAMQVAHIRRQVRARGFTQPSRVGRWGRLRLPDGERALERLVRDGAVVPVRVEGAAGRWFADAGLLDAHPAAPRTVLLSPFDDLISDRGRTERVWGFHYRIEIYVPRAQRRFGYYVLPILHGDDLIGRIDAQHDRERGVLRVDRVFAEARAPGDAGPSVRGAIDEMATWLRVPAEVRRAPAAWRSALVG